jgi:hypothetical protein
MLSAGELAQMRHTVSHGLPDLCTVKRVVLSPDGQGGYVETWATLYSSVPCRLRPAPVGARTGQDVAGQWQVASAWYLVVAYDQALASGDRVVLGGDTYHVISVDDDMSERVLRTAYLRRVD